MAGVPPSFKVTRHVRHVFSITLRQCAHAAPLVVEPVHKEQVGSVLDELPLLEVLRHHVRAANTPLQDLSWEKDYAILELA